MLLSRPAGLRSQGLLGARTLLVLLALLATETPAQEPESQPKEPQRINIEIPSEEGALTEWVLDRYSRLPPEYTLLGREFRQQTNLVVDSLIVGGRIHVKKFPENAQRTEVLAILAHCLGVNYKRHISGNRKEYKEVAGERMPMEEQREELHAYLEELYHLARAGLARDPEPEFRCLLELATGDAHYAVKEYAEAVAAYQRGLDADPDGPRARRATSSLGLSQYYAGDYAGSRKVLATYLRRWPGSTLYPEHLFSLHRAYRASGLIHEGFALWRMTLPSLEAGASGEPIPDTDPPRVVPEQARKRYQEFVSLQPYFLAFYRMAQGEHQQAAGHFENFIDATRKLSPMPARVEVFHHFQAIPYVTFCTGLAGRPFPVDDLGEGWIERPEQPIKGPALVYLSSPVIALRSRYEKLTRLLPKIAASMSEPVQLWWIRLGKRYDDDEERAENLEQSQAELAEAAASVGFLGALGVDVDRKLYESLFIEPGTPHLYVLDREGRLAWMVIDPMHWDEGLFRAVLERTLDAER